MGDDAPGEPWDFVWLQRLRTAGTQWIACCDHRRGLAGMRWPGGGIEFHPSHGDWIRILRGSGFVVEALHELYAPTTGRPPITTTSPRPSGPGVAGRGPVDRAADTLTDSSVSPGPDFTHMK